MTTTPGLVPEFTATQSIETTEDSSKLLKKGIAPVKTILEDLLEKCFPTHECIFSSCAPFINEDYPVMNHLKEQGPAAIDLAIRSLTPENDYASFVVSAHKKYSINFLKWMLDFLKNELESNSNFELVQAYMDAFLRVGSSFFTC